MTCPCHNIARDAKDVDRSQAEECADTCIEGDGRRLPEQFCQHRYCKMGIVVVVDWVAGKPHVIGGEMRAAHNSRDKALVHEHLEGVYVRHV